MNSVLEGFRHRRFEVIQEEICLTTSFETHRPLDKFCLGSRTTKVGSFRKFVF